MIRSTARSIAAGGAVILGVLAPTLLTGATATAGQAETEPPPETGLLTIVKDTVGGDGTFGFGSTFGGFEITTSGSTGSHSQEVVAAEHQVQELGGPPGWTLDSITCDGPFVLGPGASEVSVTVAAGAEVTCTFTNSLIPPTTSEPLPETGSITIVKQAVGPALEWGFTGSLGDFAIITDATGAGSQQFDDLAPGSYDVVETRRPHWAIEIECSDTDSTGDVSDPTGHTATAHIELSAGEDVTCTFTNTFSGDPNPDEPAPTAAPPSTAAPQAATSAQLPATGGIDPRLAIVAGLALLTGSMFVVVFRRPSS